MVNPKKQEEPIFEEPKFDKREYLSYERERAKAIILVFITGALVGLFSGYLEIFGYWYLAILLIIAVIYFLRRLIASKIKWFHKKINSITNIYFSLLNIYSYINNIHYCIFFMYVQ